MATEQQKQKQKDYEKYVKEITPTHSLPLNMAKAFLTGGLICVIGQWILNFAKNRGLDQEMAGSWCSLILILLSVITGFANSVAASAIEYKAEGQVFGIGCKIFTIAGPVILYGIMSSWFLGLIYYILKAIGVFV